MRRKEAILAISTVERGENCWKGQGGVQGAYLERGCASTVEKSSVRNEGNQGSKLSGKGGRESACNVATIDVRGQEDGSGYQGGI